MLLNGAMMSPLPKRNQINNWLGLLGIEDFEPHHKKIEEVGLEAWFEKFTYDRIEDSQTGTNHFTCPMCGGMMDNEIDDRDGMFFGESLTGFMTCSGRKVRADLFFREVTIPMILPPLLHCGYQAWWSIDVKLGGGYSYGITYDDVNPGNIEDIILKNEEDDDEP